MENKIIKESKDVLNVQKLISDMKSNPAECLVDLTLILAEDFRDMQLGYKNIDACLKRAVIIKTMGGNVISKWQMDNMATQRMRIGK